MLNGGAAEPAFNSIYDRVHFVIHNALAGCVHRNARRPPVVDGIE